MMTRPWKEMINNCLGVEHAYGKAILEASKESDNFENI